MNEMVAFCGLDCHQCGAFIATRDDDDSKRAEVAALWSLEFEADIQAGNINCDGCTSGSGVRFRHCEVCEIRNCGKEKGVANCAYCSEYACTNLSDFFSMAPETKTRLERIRAEM